MAEGADLQGQFAHRLEISCVQMLGASLHLLVLLTLLVELSPFNSEATFKLFFLESSPSYSQLPESEQRALLPCLLCF